MRTSSNDFLNTDSKEKSIQEINIMLSEELKKPAKKRNYDKIEELTEAYAKLMGTEAEVENAMQRCLSELRSKARPKRKFTRRMRGIVFTVSVAVLMFVMNIVTVSAFDMNVFSFIVHVADGSFSVDFPQISEKKVQEEKIIRLPVTPVDPYGMIAECAKIGLYPETPHYLPDGLFLIGVRANDIKNLEKYVSFNYIGENNKKISFSYHLFCNEIAMQGAGFPNDEHHFQEIEVNGHPAVLAIEKKDKEFTLVYVCDDLLMCHFSCWNISEEEVQKIIGSFY